MAKVCPQRILAEAVRLLSLDNPHEDAEAVDNCILELEGLSKALYRDGIINIAEVNE